MATLYCALCRRPVEARRQIGAGTVFLGVVTVGLSLLALPFYRKRCPICRSTALTQTVPVGLEAGDAQGGPRVAELEHRLRLTQEELDAAHTELDRLRTQQDFYRQLLGDRATTRDRGTNE